MSPEKRKSIIYTTGAIVVVLVIGIIVYNVFVAKKSGTDILMIPIPHLNKEALPPVPDLQVKFSLFNKITAMFGEDPKLIDGLPVEKGAQGKENPFEPFGGFNAPASAAPESSPVSSASPATGPAATSTDMGQGTK